MNLTEAKKNPPWVPLPVLNQSGVTNHPIAWNCDWFSTFTCRDPSAQKFEDYNFRVPGHYPDKDAEANNAREKLGEPPMRYFEQYVKIDGRTIVLPNNDATKMRMDFVSKANHLVIPAPTDFFASGALSMDELYMKDQMTPNTRGDAFRGVFSTICTLLGQYGTIDIPDSNNHTTPTMNIGGIDLSWRGYLGERDDEIYNLKKSKKKGGKRQRDNSIEEEMVEVDERTVVADDGNVSVAGSTHTGASLPSNRSRTSSRSSVIGGANAFQGRRVRNPERIRRLLSSVSGESVPGGGMATEDSQAVDGFEEVLHPNVWQMDSLPGFEGSRNGHESDRDERVTEAFGGDVGIDRSVTDVSEEARRITSASHLHAEEVLGEKFLTNKELSEMREGYILEGDWGNNAYFVIRKKDDPKKFIYMNRFHMDIEYRGHRSIGYKERPGFEGEHTFRFNDPEVMLIHIWIFDPRIDLLKGVDRLIRLNVKRALEEKRKKNGGYKTKKPGFSSEKKDESVFEMYQPRKHQKFLNLSGWDEWARWLSMVTDDERLIDDSLKFFGRKTNLSKLSPEFALNPFNMFYLRGPANKFSYRQLTGVERHSSGWTDEDFDRNIVHSFKDNYYRVVFQGENVLNEDRDEFGLHRLRLFVYPYCQRVVRQDLRCMSGILCTAMMFPFRMTERFLEHKAMKPVWNFPFRIQKSHIVEGRQAAMKTAEGLIAGGQIEPITQKKFYWDALFERKYGQVTPELDAERLLIQDESGSTDEEVRYLEQFEEAQRGFHPGNSELTPVFQAISGYAQDLPGDKMYPDVYDKKTFGFQAYKNLTVYGSFIVNMNEKYVNGEPLFSAKLHHLNFLMFLVLGMATRLRLGYQPYILISGPSGSGKSRLIKKAIEFAIPNTIFMINSMSGQARSVKSAFCGETQYVDDADSSSNPIFDKKSDKKGTEKTLMTTGENVRRVMRISGDTRISVDVKTYFRIASVAFSNMDFFDMEEWFRSRVLHFYAQDELKPGTIFEDETGKQRAEYGILMKSFQLFAARIGFYIACGAMTYNIQKNVKVAEVIRSRIFEPVEKVKVFPSHDNIREKDRFNVLLYAVSVHRLWVEILSGVYSMDDDLRPNMEFKLNTFRKIEHRKLLIATEEDAYVAMSFFHEAIPGAGFVAVADFFLLQCFSSVGNGIRYQPCCPFADYEKYKGSFQDSEENTFGGGNGSVSLAFVSGNGLVTPEQQQNRKNGTFEALKDHEWLTLYNKPFLGTKKVEEIVADIAKDIFVAYPHVNRKEIEFALSELMKFRFNSRKSNWVFVNGQRVLEYVDVMKTNLNKYDDPSTIRGYPSIVAEPPLQLIRRNQGPNLPSLFILKISRQWIDAVYASNPYFQTRGECLLSEEFLSSPLEELIMGSHYPEALDKTIVLPGMTLLRRNHDHPEGPCYPQIMKPFVMRTPEGERANARPLKIMRETGPVQYPPINKVTNKKSKRYKSFGDYYYQTIVSESLQKYPVDVQTLTAFPSGKMSPQYLKEAIEVFSPDNRQNLFYAEQVRRGRTEAERQKIWESKPSYPQASMEKYISLKEQQDLSEIDLPNIEPLVHDTFDDESDDEQDFKQEQVKGYDYNGESQEMDENEVDEELSRNRRGMYDEEHDSEEDDFGEGHF